MKRFHHLNCVMGLHSQMQLVMVRGLFYTFKQPIFVDFDRKMSCELLDLCPVVPPMVINLYARSRIYMGCKFANRYKKRY